MKKWLLASALFFHIAPAYSAACEGQAYHALDFRVGTYDGKTANGQAAGVSVVEKIAGGCALLENWRGAQGGDGTGLFNLSGEQWYFTYVNEDGETLRMIGKANTNAITFTGKNRFYDMEGLHRISWHRLPDGNVRQLWELQRKSRGAWSVVADIILARRRPAATQ
jgi:hypothetical protein